jgi:hypothetical protein
MFTRLCFANFTVPYYILSHATAHQTSTAKKSAKKSVMVSDPAVGYFDGRDHSVREAFGDG